MPVTEEKFDYEINLKIAKALADLKELNKSASGLPEVVANVNSALEKMSVETGIGLGAIEKKFVSMGRAAQEAQSLIQNASLAGIDTSNLPFTEMDKALLRGGQPFGDLGESAGYKAAAEARREAAILSKQQQASEALIAKELNDQAKKEAEILALKQRELTVTGQQEARLEAMNAELLKIQAAGKLNLSGSNYQQIESLKSIIGGVSKSTGAQYGEVANQLQKMGVPAAQAKAAVKGLNAEMLKGTKDAQGYGHGIDVFRTALGTLTAVGIFTVLSAISRFFTDSIKSSQELEDSMYRLSNTERILSQQGIEVSTKGFEDGIKRIKKLMPIFSKEDITGVVGQLAITTQGLGLTEKQILDLSQAITILNVNSAEAETLQATTQHIISSIITDNARGVANLGLDMSKAAIEAKALNMGLLVQGETSDSLSEYEKTMVKVQIAIDKAGVSMDGLNGYMETNTAKIQMNKAAWHDVETTWGSLFTTLTPLATKFFEMLDNAGKMLNTIVLSGYGLIQMFSTLSAFFGKDKGLDKFNEKLDEVNKKIKAFAKNLFPGGNPFGEGSLGDKIFGKLFEQIDTPTSPLSGISEKAKEDAANLEKAVSETETKIQDIMQDARDKREQIETDYMRKIEDANRDHAQKLEDIARDVARKQEDALRNYNEKVEDINRDANEKITEAQQDARQKELDREKEFQNKLRELRERFLFDLEDALRERDARQVLRLIREYNFDKKNLEEKHKLERQEAKKDLADKLADIERERQIKLEAAKRELAEKQAEIKIWQDRERADAQLALSRKLADARRWHQQELAEYRQYLQRKLQDLAQAIAREYQLTAAGAAAIQSLLSSYMGTGGTGSLNNLTNSLSSSLGGTSSGGFTTFSPNGVPTYNPYDIRARFAEGGTFVATRPSKILVGENGPEKISVSPIGRVGNNQNKVFGDIGGGQNNSLDLRIQLTEGLVAEIIDSSLDSVAAHIERISREK